MKKKELWVHNPGTSDISLSDLGVKVSVGNTIDIYKTNPYLTAEQVEKSMSEGSLYKRLSVKALIVVNKKPATPPKVMKAADGAVHARKTKSSIVIETDMDDPEEEGRFEFADYGINDLGAVNQERNNGAVVVNAAQDKIEQGESEEGAKTFLAPDLVAKATVATKDRPFTVVAPPQKEDEPDAKMTPSGEWVSKGPSDEIVVSGTKPTSQTRGSLKTVKETIKDGPHSEEDDEVGADEVIEFEETEFDTKVATATEDGSVIMKIKEEPKKKAVVKKPRISKKK